MDEERKNMIERLITHNLSFLKKYSYCDEKQIDIYKYEILCVKGGWFYV
jgi:hypothetical protein